MAYAHVSVGRVDSETKRTGDAERHHPYALFVRVLERVHRDSTPVGHTSVQQPHSPQRRGSCSSTWSSSSSPNAPVGHSFTHAPQPRHIKDRSIITDTKITLVQKHSIYKLYHESAESANGCAESGF